MGDENRFEGDAPAFINLPTELENALKSAGLSDYRDMFTGTAGAARQLGLTGQQAEMFQKFAMPFQQKRFTDLLGSLKPYEEREQGFIQRQFDIGSQNVQNQRTSLQNQFQQGRSGLRDRLMSSYGGAAQQAAARGFAGSGAAQTGLARMTQGVQSSYGGMVDRMGTGLAKLDTMQDSLGLGMDRSQAKLQDQLGARRGQALGLLGDYASQIMGLGREFLSYNPAGSGSGTGGTGGTGGGAGGAGGSNLPTTRTSVETSGTGDQAGATGGFTSGGRGADMGDTASPSGDTSLSDSLSGYTDEGQSMDDTQLTGDEYDDMIEGQGNDADRRTALTGVRQPGATETADDIAARRQDNEEKDTVKDTVGTDEGGNTFEGSSPLSARINQSAGGSPLGAPKPKTQYAPNWRQNIATSAELQGDASSDMSEVKDRLNVVPSAVPPGDADPNYTAESNSLVSDAMSDIVGDEGVDDEDEGIGTQNTSTATTNTGTAGAATTGTATTGTDTGDTATTGTATAATGNTGGGRTETTTGTATANTGTTATTGTTQGSATQSSSDVNLAAEDDVSFEDKSEDENEDMSLLGALTSRGSGSAANQNQSAGLMGGFGQQNNMMQQLAMALARRPARAEKG